MRLSKTSEHIGELVLFRQRMGMELSKAKAVEIWGKQAITDYLSESDGGRADLPALAETEKESAVVQKKVDILGSSLDGLMVGGWVKFIGITGSVAAGFASDDDDIDVFVVVKNHTAWIYRFLVKLKGRGMVLNLNSDSKRDRICINFISEERGLSFPWQDIFTLHEIFYMKPLFNEGYFHEILIKNTWLERFGVKIGGMNSVNSRSYREIIWLPVNFVMMLLQLTYMIIARHSPEVLRILRGFKDGRITFYPSRESRNEE